MSSRGGVGISQVITQHDAQILYGRSPVMIPVCARTPTFGAWKTTIGRNSPILIIHCCRYYALHPEYVSDPTATIVDFVLVAGIVSLLEEIKVGYEQ